MNTTYDLVIIGGGPAGAAGAVYAARKRLKTLVITKDWLGQSNVSEKIENWVGTVAISGLELSKNLEMHAKEYGKDVMEFKDGEYVTDIRDWRLEIGESQNKNPTSDLSSNFTVTTNKASYEARSILVTSGSSRRKLEVPGADIYEHKGLTYCATCDGPLYNNQDVVVIGGGNAGFESAAQLLAYCKSVTLLSRSEYKADPGTIDAVTKNPKFKGVEFAIPKQVIGDKFVTSLVYTDKNNQDITLDTTGIFVEVGSVPNTNFLNKLIKLDKYNHIAIDARNQRTSTDGIWAAGDVTNGLYHQNNIAAGDAVKAIEDIYIWLHKNK